MKTRIITSAVGIPIVFLVLFFYDTIIFNLCLLAICLIAVYESCKAFNMANLPVFLGFVPLISVCMMYNYTFAQQLILPILLISVIYFAAYVVFNFEKVSYQKLAGAFMLNGIVLFCFASAIKIKTLMPVEKHGYNGIFLILICLAIAWGGDSMAYFAGRFFGKKKLCPIVSPKKTVEGLYGGILGSILLSVLFTFLYGVLLDSIHVDFGFPTDIKTYLIISAIAFVGSLLGVLGDLLASAVKRQVGIKDYGTIFPGHGGILDRFDSVLFIWPLMCVVAELLLKHDIAFVI